MISKYIQPLPTETQTFIANRNCILSRQRSFNKYPSYGIHRILYLLKMCVAKQNFNKITHTIAYGYIFLRWTNQRACQNTNILWNIRMQRVSNNAIAYQRKCKWGNNIKLFSICSAYWAVYISLLYKVLSIWASLKQQKVSYCAMK